MAVLYPLQSISAHDQKMGYVYMKSTAEEGIKSIYIYMQSIENGENCVQETEVEKLNGMVTQGR